MSQSKSNYSEDKPDSLVVPLDMAQVYQSLFTQLSLCEAFAKLNKAAGKLRYKTEYSQDEYALIAKCEAFGDKMQQLYDMVGYLRRSDMSEMIVEGHEEGVAENAARIRHSLPVYTSEIYLSANEIYLEFFPDEKKDVFNLQEDYEIALKEAHGLALMKGLNPDIIYEKPVRQ